MCLNNTTDAPLKICSKCGVSKPATSEYFAPRKSTPDGLRKDCKQCKAEYDRARREANPNYNVERCRKWRESNIEYAREQQRAAYAANPEPVKKRAKLWYDANHDRALEYHRSHYAANPERTKRNRLAWVAKNPEAIKAIRQRRRARKRNAEGTHTAADIQAQYKAQKGKCYYCGVKVGDTYHVDHVIPLSRGGSNWPENLVIACASCNSSKQDKLPHEWIEGGRLL